MSNKLKKIKVALALGIGVPADMQEALDAAVQEINQKAAAENRSVQVENIAVCVEGKYSGFYRESPRLLIQKIDEDYSPDIIIAVFHGRFGTGMMKDAPTSTTERDRFAEMRRQPGSPHVRLYFLEKDFNPSSTEEEIQKEYFRDFRSVTHFSDSINHLWWWVKNKKGLQKTVSTTLWELIRQQSRKGLLPDGPEKPSRLELPDGWQHIDAAFLEKMRAELGADGRLDQDEAASFFDGESPKWKHIVSASIRPREAVARLGKEIGELASRGRTRVTLLRGPSGEGKSTILQQVAAKLAEDYPGINVIWRDLEAINPASLEETWLRPLLERDEYFVIVCDNAAQIAEDIWQSVISLSERRSNIQFLLASSNLDWEWKKADEKPWRIRLGGEDFHIEPVRGLTEEDTKRVVESWEEAGAAGLGSFIKIEKSRRVSTLFTIAKEEERKTPQEGAFLGAMLEARKSDTFNDYVLSILQRLEQRTIPNGKTLQKVFAYIAALHADGQRILTKPILRHLLKCSEDEFELEVIRPLGKEAVVSAGWLVLTRHQTIARVARRILADEDGPYRINFEREIIPQLMRAAYEKYHTEDGEVEKEELTPWNRLPRIYDERGQIELAFRLSKVWADAEIDNPVPVIEWAKLYRKHNMLRDAALLFRRRYSKISPKKISKAYFTQWATAEGLIKNHCHDAWLAGITLSDTLANHFEGDKSPLLPLAGITPAFKALYEKTSDPHKLELYDPSHGEVFLQASSAAGNLGHDTRAQRDVRPEHLNKETMGYLHQGQTLGSKHNIQQVDPPEAINRIISGINLAHELGEIDKEDWPDSLPRADQLTFTGLRKLFAVP